LALICCASRVLSKYEKNYSITELELLCVVWGIQHFRPYLYGRTFQIITDHQALTTVMKMKNPTSKITRMLLQLQEYDYYFSFRPGKLHHAADALTRLPTIDEIDDNNQNQIEGNKEVLLLELADELFYFDPYSQLSEAEQTELNSIQRTNDTSNEPSISLEQFQIEQRKDPDLNPLFQFLEHNELTGNYKIDAQTITWSRYLTIQNNLLFHFQNLSGSNRYPKTVQQLVVPFSLIRSVISLIHTGDLCGHPGVKKTFEKVREQFYWKHMFNDIVEFVTTCESCQVTKPPAPPTQMQVQYLQRPQPTRPWQIISTDVLHLPTSNASKKYVVIFVDLFTRYPEAFAMLYANGTTLGKHLIKNIICRHGCPSQILCDNASYNVKGYFKELCDKFSIKLSPVAEYHPEANGVAESKVKALKSLLRSLVEEFDDWEERLPQALFAYRSTFNPKISASPFFLNHGREPTFPNKLQTQLDDSVKSITNKQHFLDLVNQMGTTFKFTAQNLAQAQAKLVHPTDMPEFFKTGDKVHLFSPVLHKNERLAFKKFWSGPFEIVKKINPVIFRIKRLNNDADIQDVYVKRLKKAHTSSGFVSV